MTLVLDRMAIEEVGANPARLAAAIHLQLGAATGAVPVNDIAHALDIQEIRVEHLSNIEGALIAPPERGAGRILVNNSHPRRQRFTVAHELGHYLSPHHVPTAETGFWCTQSDLSVRPSSDRARHRRQEGEANLFAIELLAPRSRARRFCTGRPDIARILPRFGPRRTAPVVPDREHAPAVTSSFIVNRWRSYSARTAESAIPRGPRPFPHSRFGRAL